LSLTFDIDNGLVLLFNQHGHFREHLCELGKGLFDLLDFGMSFLDFTVCTSSSTISVRVEELHVSVVLARKGGAHSLGEDLRVITFSDLPNFLLGSLRVDNLVLSLNPILDLFPELLLYDLVLIQKTGEPSLDLLDLGLHGSVSLGHLEQLLDLVLALLSGRLGFRVELVDLHGSARVGCRLLSVYAMTEMGPEGLRVTFGERIEQPESALATESSSGWCLSILTRKVHRPVDHFQLLPWRTAPVDRTAVAGHKGYLLEPAERTGFHHSFGSAVVRRTGCRHHLVLRRLPVRHKDWYLEMVGLRHWREGGMTPAEEQKHLYTSQYNAWSCSRRHSHP
jgi:hypothetical protein